MRLLVLVIVGLALASCKPIVGSTSKDASGDAGTAVGDNTTKEEVVDDIPDPFGFTDQTNYGTSNLVTSNQITVSGISSDISASLTGADFTVYKNGTAQTGDFTVSAEDKIYLTVTSPSTYGSTNTATLRIGQSSASWKVGTYVPSSTYSFVSQTGVEPNTLIYSNAITITGFTGTQAVSVSGCAAKKNNAYTEADVIGGFYLIGDYFPTKNDGTNFVVSAGDNVILIQRSGFVFDGTTRCTFTLGGITSEWSFTVYKPTLYGYFNPPTKSVGSIPYGLMGHFAIPITLPVAASVRYFGVGSTCFAGGGYGIKVYSDEGGKPGKNLSGGTIDNSPTLALTVGGVYPTNTGGTATLPSLIDQSSLTNRIAMLPGNYWLVTTTGTQKSNCNNIVGTEAPHNSILYSSFGMEGWTTINGLSGVTVWMAD